MFVLHGVTFAIVMFSICRSNVSEVSRATSVILYSGSFDIIASSLPVAVSSYCLRSASTVYISVVSVAHFDTNVSVGKSEHFPSMGACQL